MMDIAWALLLTNLATTWYLVGVIWFVQLVHYPLMAEVGRENFARYETMHRNRTGRVVLVPMVIELGTSVMLIVVRPAEVSFGWAMLGLALVIVIWASTFLGQVPRHEALSHGFDSGVHRQLVRGNWVRTVCWSARGIVALQMVQIMFGCSQVHGSL